MSRSLAKPAAVALAAVGLAVGTPITAHAQLGTGSGKCPNSSVSLFGGLSPSGNIFKQRNTNCVELGGVHDFAFMDEESNTNLAQIFGDHNGLQFVNSSNNLVSFDQGNGGGSTLLATGADFNGVEFGPTSANDVLTMVGTQGVGVGITGIDDFLLTDSSCTPGTVIIYTQSGRGTASNPIVLC